MPNKSCAQTSTGEEEDPPSEAIDKSKTISERDGKENVKTSAREFNSFVFFLLHKKYFFVEPFFLLHDVKKNWESR